MRCSVAVARVKGLASESCGVWGLLLQVSDLLDRLYDRLDDAADAEGVTKVRALSWWGWGMGGFGYV